MLTLEDTVEIKVLHKQGKSIRAIARETGYLRNTIRAYLRSNKEPEYKRRVKRPSKLDGYKQYLEERVKSAQPHVIPAVVLALVRKLKDQINCVQKFRDWGIKWQIHNLIKPILKSLTCLSGSTSLLTSSCGR